MRTCQRALAQNYIAWIVAESSRISRPDNATRAKLTSRPTSEYLSSECLGAGERNAHIPTSCSIFGYEREFDDPVTPVRTLDIVVSVIGV